jgi:hypothetical protein
MASYSQLPPDTSEALDFFNEVLCRPDETLVLILGQDDTAIYARRIIDDIIEEDDSMFRYVNFVGVGDPEIIREKLENLTNDDVNLANMHNYVFITISPFKNIISDAITKSRFMKGPGSLTTAVLHAIHNG